MINTKQRKLALSGWLQKNDPASYSESLKLQKFLFFYEVLCKSAGDATELTNLQGWKDGPVFSRVWGDYTYDRHEFDQAAAKAYGQDPDIVEQARAKKADFIIQSLAPQELSEVTHAFHIWSKHAERIAAGEQHVHLDEGDFNAHDYGLIQNLETAYPSELVATCSVHAVKSTRFVIPTAQMGHFEQQHWETLNQLALEPHKLHNPVYVQLDEDGCLLLD